MALSYEFSIGSVRAKENSLLREADIEMMISLKSEKELVRHLKDKGYGQGETTDEILASNEEKMWKYIRSIAPDMELFEPFLIQNDIHNLKTVLKGTMSDREYDTLLMEPCTIKKDELVKAVENRRFDSFPQWLQRPASRAYQILADSIAEQVQLAQSENATIVTKSIHLCGEMASDLAFVSALREKMPDCQLTPMDSFSNLRLPTEADDAAAVLSCVGAIGAALNVEGV